MATDDASESAAELSPGDRFVSNLRDIVEQRRAGVLLPLIAPVVVALLTVVLMLVLPAIVVAPIATVAAVSAAMLVWSSGVWTAESQARESRDLADVTRSQLKRLRHITLFEGGSLFYATWYITLRLREEAERAKRYGQPLSVLVLAPAGSAEAGSSHDLKGLEDAIRYQVRASDLPGVLPDDHVAIVLPNADAKEARAAKRRLEPHAAKFGYALGVATQKGERANHDELVTAALDSISRQQKRETQRAA